MEKKKLLSVGRQLVFKNYGLFRPPGMHRPRWFWKKMERNTSVLALINFTAVKNCVYRL